MPAKRAVEIGQVREPDLQGDRAYCEAGKARSRKHAVGPGEPLFEHVFGERAAFGLEQKLNVARRDAMTARNCGNGKLLVREMRVDVRPDRIEPRGAQAAATGKLGRITAGADCHRHEVVHVGGKELAQIGRGDLMRLNRRHDVIDQQP